MHDALPGTEPVSMLQAVHLHRLLPPGARSLPPGLTQASARHSTACSASRSQVSSDLDKPLAGLLGSLPARTDWLPSALPRALRLVHVTSRI